MKSMKKIAIVILALCVLCTPAFAAEENYVAITGNEYYDLNSGSFFFTSSQIGTGKIYSSVASGMMTTEPVCIVLPTGFSATLYQDGFVRDNVDFTAITDPGEYTLCLSGSDNLSSRVLSFTIVNSVSGAMEEYELPSGFSLNKVTRDGTTVSTGGSVVDFTEEGTYSVKYMCNASGVEYQLNVTIDHTPPVLALTNVEDGVAKGPVDLSDMETGASLAVEHNGEAMKDVGDVLDETGDYYLFLTDEAGNSTEYTFHIGVYFNISSLGFFLLVLAVIGALLWYVIHVRRKTRVR